MAGERVRTDRQVPQDSAAVAPRGPCVVPGFCLLTGPGVSTVAPRMQASGQGSPGNNPSFGGCSRTRPLEQPRRLQLFPGIPGMNRMRFNTCSAAIRHRPYARA